MFLIVVLVVVSCARPYAACMPFVCSAASGVDQNQCHSMSHSLQSVSLTFGDRTAEHELFRERDFVSSGPKLTGGTLCASCLPFGSIRTLGSRGQMFHLNGPF